MVVATGHSDPSKVQMFGPRACRVDATMHAHARKEDGKSIYVQEGLPVLHGVVTVDSSCDPGMVLSFDVGAIDMSVATAKVLHYSLFASVLTILQIRLFLMQMQNTDEGPLAAKVSIVCLVLQVFMDAYDSLLHVGFGLSSSYVFHTIAIVALFKFILFSVVEARYFLSVWRQRRSEALNQDVDMLRRELTLLYSRFYGAMLLGLLILYRNMRYLHILVLGFQLYWIPQIVRDAWLGTRSALQPTFIVGVSITRLLQVVYLWGCPDGVFNGELFPKLTHSPNATVCAVAVLLQGAQVCVMLLQRSKGPRWFIPWACMPTVYNYYHATTITLGTECVICMVDIDPEDARRVVTPCSHLFHASCLEQWLDVKLECPTCRRTLPPIL